MTQDNPHDLQGPFAGPKVWLTETSFGGIRASLSEEEVRRWLEGLLQAMPDVVVVYDMAEEEALYVNDRIRSYFGYSPREVREWGGQLLQKIVHPDDLAAVRAFYAAFEDAGADEVRTMSYRIRHKNGDYRWVDNQGVVFQRAGDGRVWQLLLVERDVTHLKQAEQVLREQERQRSLALNSIGVSEWMLDPVTDEVYWSEGLRGLLGVDPETQLTLELAMSFVHPDDRADVLEALQMAGTSSIVYHREARLLNPDGRISWVDARGYLRPVITPQGQQVPKLAGIMVDITQRKEAEEILRDWNAKLHFLSQVAMDLLAAEDEQAISALFGPICKRFGYDICFNFMATDRGQNLHLVGHCGLTEDTVNQLRRLPFGQTLCCTANELPCHIDVGSIEQPGPSLIELLKKLQIRAYACSPLLHNGQLIGTLAFGSRSRPAFAESDLTFLKTLSHYVLMARERMRAIKALQEAQSQLEERVKARTAELEHSNQRLLQEIEERRQAEEALSEVRRHLDQSREKERLRLARDLHDGPMQDLSTIIYQLSTLAQKQTDEHLATVLAVSAAQIEKVNGKLRTFARDLRPPVLTSFGLLAALEDHVIRFQRQHETIKVTLDLPDQDEIADEIQSVALYRICEQALHNIAQHARATSVRVALFYGAEQIVLEVEDNGQGFEVPAHWVVLVRDGHMGLAGMVERAEDAGGRLEVISKTGHGTLVRVQIPRPVVG
jgi:PAS domain S-box-containing protein